MNTVTVTPFAQVRPRDFWRAAPSLASLRTRAVDAGDHRLIKKQSGAQDSDRCGQLVRAEPPAGKHHGISFMLIEMHQPGDAPNRVDLRRQGVLRDLPDRRDRAEGWHPTCPRKTADGSSAGVTALRSIGEGARRAFGDPTAARGS